MKFTASITRHAYTGPGRVRNGRYKVIGVNLYRHRQTLTVATMTISRECTSMTWR